MVMIGWALLKERIWLLPLLPLVGSIACALVAWRWGRRTAGWVALASLVLAAASWGASLVALSALPDVHRGYILQFSLWSQDNPGLLLSLHLDRLSGVLGLTVAVLSLLVHCFTLGQDPEALSGAGTLGALGMLSLLFLAGDCFLLLMAWIGLSWITYALSDTDTEHLRRVIALGSLSDGALGYAVLGLSSTCQTAHLASFDRWVASGSGYNDPAALRIATGILLAVGARILQMASLTRGRGGAPSPVKLAQICGILLVPGLLYLPLRAQDALLGTPIFLHRTYWLGVVGLLLFTLMLWRQRNFGRAILFVVLAEACFSLAALVLGVPAHLAYQIVLQGVLATALLLWVELVYSLSRGNYALDSPLLTPAFVLIALAQLGVPFLSGHYGKGRLLAIAYRTGHRTLWVVGMVSIVLTSSYVWRRVLWGWSAPTPSLQAEEGDTQGHPMWMWFPLTVLMVVAAAGGLAADHLRRWLSPTLLSSELHMNDNASAALLGSVPVWLAAASALAALIGFLWAWWTERRSARWRVEQGLALEHPGPVARPLIPIHGRRGLADILCDRWQGIVDRLRGGKVALPPEFVGALAIGALLLFFLWVRG